MRAAVPQVLTGIRVILGAAAIITALHGQHFTAAALITFGAVTDVLDGFLARRLGVSSAFGAMFDVFSDYLCFIVAPWMLVRLLVAADANLWLEILIGLPLLTGAIRYARISLLMINRTSVTELPGLPTVFFAFLPVAVVFLDAGQHLTDWRPAATLVFLAVILSLLMLAPVRYPKLTRFKRWVPLATPNRRRWEPETDCLAMVILALHSMACRPQRIDVRPPQTRLPESYHWIRLHHAGDPG